MKPEEIPVLQLPAEILKTQKAAIIDMSNKEMMPWNGPQAPNPSHAACGAQGSSASSGAGAASSSPQEDRIQVRLHSSKNQEKAKQITNFLCLKRDVASTRGNSSGQCFGLFMSMDRSTSKYRKKICVGQEMRAFSFFLSALFSFTIQKKLIYFKMVK